MDQRMSKKVVISHLNFWSQLSIKASRLCLITEIACNKLAARQMVRVFGRLKESGKISKLAEKVRIRREDTRKMALKVALVIWLKMAKEHQMKLEFRLKTFSKMKAQKTKLQVRNTFTRWKFIAQDSRKKLSNFASFVKRLQQKQFYVFISEFKSIANFETRLLQLENLITKAKVLGTFQLLVESYKNSLWSERLMEDRAVAFKNRKLLTKALKSLASRVALQRLHTEAYFILETKSHMLR